MESTPATAPTARAIPLQAGHHAGPAAAPAPASHPGRVPRTETLLRIDQVEARLGFKKSKIYALAKEEPLLRPVRISARCVAWPESRIAAYVEKVIAQSDAEASPLLPAGDQA